MFERELVLLALVGCLPLSSTSQVHLLFKAQLKCPLLQAGFMDPNYSSSQTGVSSAKEWVNPTLGAERWLHPTVGVAESCLVEGALNWLVKEKGFQSAMSRGKDLSRRKEKHEQMQGFV